MKKRLQIINGITVFTIFTLFTSTLTANNEQSINTKSTTSVNNSVDCTVEYFKVMELNKKLYFKFLVVENKDNIAYVLESSENGNEYNAIQIKEGFKSPNQVPLLYCYSEKLINNTSYRIKRVSSDGVINYSGSITINTDHQSNKWISSINDEFNKNCFSLNINSNFSDKNNLSDNITSQINSIEIESNISIYPNPNQGLININFGSLENISIKIFNINGQLVLQENNINGATYQFELNEIPGIYFIDIVVQNHQKQFTIVKK